MAVEPPRTSNSEEEPPDYGTLIEEDRVHSSLYTRPDIYEDELRRIWYGSWVFIGHESEVAEPGDYATRQIGRKHLILTRDEDGDLHLFHNQCTHRGNLVCNNREGHSNVFRCSYHGWTFNNQGDLIGVPYDDGYGDDFDKSELGLSPVENFDQYRGFLFTKLSPGGPSLEEYLGAATDAIDRLVDLSPEGEISLDAGWVNQKTQCNWKMIIENEPDGYHPRFVHQSLFKVIESRMDEGTRKQAGTVTRDLGNGHTEIDFGPCYREFDEKLVWFDRADPEKFSDYIQSLEDAVGEDEAHRRLVDGPPHVMIFPNLFLAEMNILTVRPQGVNETIQAQTPVQLKGAPRVNKRAFHQFEGAMGPAGFLLGDDAEIYERTQMGVENRSPEWVQLRRGKHREKQDDRGFVVADLTDETPMRAIWKQYRNLMLDGEGTQANGG